MEVYTEEFRKIITKKDLNISTFLERLKLEQADSDIKKSCEKSILDKRDLHQGC